MNTIFESPAVLSGKINIVRSLNETFSSDKKDPNKPYEYMVAIRIPIGTKDEKELAFLNQLAKAEQLLIEEGKKTARAVDPYRVIIDPRTPNFKDLYTSSTLSKEDFTIRLRAKARRENPHAKSYEVIQIVDANAVPLKNIEALSIFRDGCRVKVAFKLYSFLNNGKVGVSTSLVGLQYCDQGEPFTLGESIDFKPFQTNLTAEQAIPATNFDMQQYI